MILLFLTALGGFLRFYKLNWGSGFFFHPDERNIASAVLSLDPAKGDFNPNFFAYGSFPIYLTYAIGAVLTFLTKTNWLEFGKVILLGRAISAALSTLLIPLVYLVTTEVLAAGEEKKSPAVSLLAATFTVFTPGLIQYAHFSTFEIILTFEYLLVLYFALKIAKYGRWRDYIFCAVLIGVAIATKITSLLILPILPLAHFAHIAHTPSQLLQNCRGRKNFVAKIWLRIKQNFLQSFRDREKIVVALLLTILIAFASSPYNILDFSSFRGVMDYEGGVATGSLPVFYTTQFIDTTPFWYQLTQVFPYILGWPLAVIGFIAFFFFLRHLSVLRNLLLLTIPVFYFGFHGMLFVKWTRYMIPMLPFLIIMSVFVFWKLIAAGKTGNWLFFLPATLLLAVVIVVATGIQGFSFFTIYLRPDTRVAAAEWAAQNIPRDAKIISEVWDLGLIAFNPHFDNIELFDFYELDANEMRMKTNKDANKNQKLDELVQLLEGSEYIIVPSRRIYGTRLRLPKQFPTGARYYQVLFDGTLGFTKIAEFDSRPWWFSEANAEETFKVFDHPKVMIFKKVKSMTQTQYLSLLLR